MYEFKFNGKTTTEKFNNYDDAKDWAERLGYCNNCEVTFKRIK